jgi:hypothetical protein
VSWVAVRIRTLRVRRRDCELEALRMLCDRREELTRRNTALPCGVRRTWAGWRTLNHPRSHALTRDSPPGDLERRWQIGCSAQ